MLSRAQILFANTYYLLLALTVVAVSINLFFDWFFVFFLPFIIGGVGSLILFIIKTAAARTSKEDPQALMKIKIICHACCASVYIIGAFLLLVFYNANFYAAWSFHIWIIPMLIVAGEIKKERRLMLLLLFGIFMALFVLDLGGLLGRTVFAMGMGSFWGFSFYFLLVFLNDITEHTKKHTDSEAFNGLV